LLYTEHWQKLILFFLFLSFYTFFLPLLIPCFYLSFLSLFLLFLFCMGKSDVSYVNLNLVEMKT
jgi:hypothetical protein